MSTIEELKNTAASDKEIYRLQAEICRTLADPNRLELLDLLKNGERTVTELVESTGLRQANVSQHLAVMRQAGLVNTRRQGTTIYYSLAYPAIIQACAITRQILVERLAEGHKLYSSFQKTGDETSL